MRAFRRALGALSVCLILAWLTMMMPLPWALASGVLGIVAAVLVVRLVITGWRAQRRTTAILTAVVGLPACVMLVVSAVLSGVFYGPVSELQQCRAEAITHTAQDRCQDQAASSISQWLTDLLGG